MGGGFEARGKREGYGEEGEKVGEDGVSNHRCGSSCGWGCCGGFEAAALTLNLLPIAGNSYGLRTGRLRSIGGWLRPPRAGVVQGGSLVDVLH